MRRRLFALVVGGITLALSPAAALAIGYNLDHDHDVENVVITDASVFPTSTGYGPTLTLVALAVRASRALAGLEPLRSTRPA